MTNEKTITVTIEESSRAKMVKDSEGRVAWIPKRFFEGDAVSKDIFNYGLAYANELRDLRVLADRSKSKGEIESFKRSLASSEACYFGSSEDDFEDYDLPGIKENDMTGKTKEAIATYMTEVEKHGLEAEDLVITAETVQNFRDASKNYRKCGRIKAIESGIEGVTEAIVIEDAQIHRGDQRRDLFLFQVGEHVACADV